MACVWSDLAVQEVLAEKLDDTGDMWASELVIIDRLLSLRLRLLGGSLYGNMRNELRASIKG